MEVAGQASIIRIIDCRQTDSYAKGFRGLLTRVIRKPRIAIKGIAKIRAHLKNVNRGPREEY
jgi:hypothetical protein